ncbi:exonuclease SbcC [Azoarcus sp. CIB]|nr:exonuclease SbcC [Azoarcus sp. CIB]
MGALRQERTTLQAQSRELEAQRTGLAERVAAATVAWADARTAQAEAFGEVPPDATTDAKTWLADRNTALGKDREALAREEAALRAAQEALKQARSQHEQSSVQLGKTQETLNTLRQRLGEIGARREAAEANHNAAEQRLNSQLTELEPMQAELGEAEWRAAWTADPAGHRAALERSARDWRAQDKAANELRQRIAQLDTALDGARKLTEQASKHYEAARLKATTAASAVEAKRQARAQVFAGLRLPAGNEEDSERDAETFSVAEIEATLEAANARSTQRLDACEVRLKDCATALTRAQSALEGLTRRKVDTEAARGAAETALTEWIANFNADTTDAPLDRRELATLLAHDAAWLAAERKALQALDTAVATAMGALTTLTQQRQAHQAARPAWSLPIEDAPAALDAALAEVRSQIDAVRGTLEAVKLALSQDDLARRQSAELVAQIDAQEAAARVWAQMNELIGSADGKKFRNYAQQLTLDILIAYANEHLKDLARRYRLERVPNTLALMVIDQDMGDEHRSVHSLSGGESFLVSLALALGLASLSSHRVCVESLFIDEGFGSLDADTLRIAMDALDSLQSLGRKVGVISHVAEMTERIGTRIVLKRQPGGQSRVVVENAAA